jgi:hypothetical protein
MNIHQKDIFSNLLIPYARDSRTLNIVRLPRDVLRHPTDAHYEEGVHKGHLQCPDCDARIHFREAVPSRGGDNLSGAQAHFHTNPGQKHKDGCGILQAQLDREASARDPVNKNLGFVFNLNTFDRKPMYRDVFSRITDGGIYRRESRVKVRIPAPYDQDLKGMERVAVDSVEDIAQVLRTADIERVRKSLIMHREHIIRWDDFCIFRDPKQNGPEDTLNLRMKKFVQSLKRGQAVPCLIEIETRKGQLPKDFFQQMKVQGVSTFLERSDSGIKHFAQPVLELDSQLNYHFTEAGKYLILGYARVHRFASKDGRESSMTFINIRVDDPRQVMRGSLLDLALENRRHNGKTPKPTSNPTPP